MANTAQGSSEAREKTRPADPKFDGTAINTAAANPHTAVALPSNIPGQNAAEQTCSAGNVRANG